MRCSEQTTRQCAIYISSDRESGLITKGEEGGGCWGWLSSKMVRTLNFQENESTTEERNRLHMPSQPFWSEQGKTYLKHYFIKTT